MPMTQNTSPPLIEQERIEAFTAALALALERIVNAHREDAPAQPGSHSQNTSNTENDK